MLPRHVYVHVPFCARRCAYCDFSIAVRADVPVDDYVAAVEGELALRFGPGDAWVADTLYFGGGTPSRLGAAGVEKLIAAVLQRVTLAPGAEVTLEANPEDITRANALAWQQAGVNRLSVGSQSFDDRVLAWMHRTHDAVSIDRAVEHARAAGIDDLSLDLIYALPGEVERSWELDLARALALEPSHLSLYGLTVEPHTALGRWRDRGAVTEAPEERYEREFLLAHDVMCSAGFEHYEVSNYARAGRRSRHNSAYWTGAAYAGIGPSAHEFDGSMRRWNVAPWTEWQRRLRDNTDPLDASESLTPDNRAAEAVYLGLRSSAGLPLCGAELPYVERWLAAGWGFMDADSRLVLTPTGWLRLDALAADLTVFRSRL